MNGAQLHLAINHFPVVSSFLTLLLLAWAWKTNSADLKKAGLVFVVLGAAFTIATYLTGDPAEEVLKKLPGFSESLLNEHEEAAEFALIISCVAGVVACAALYFAKKSKQRFAHYAFLISIFLSLLLCTVFLRTAHLGGLIKHDEIRPAAHGACVENFK